MPDLLERLKAALVDRYAVKREIGRGGMATVYLAEDLKHRRKVAIKVLHPSLAQTVGGDRFLAEIETVAGLNHPHILSLFDSGATNGLVYYVMPFVDGESLRDRLEREQQLPIKEAIRIAQEVADGLGYAHRHGVIHRDIKPANVMLSEGHALIADFGVARAVGGEGQALTNTGLAVGTPAYMSPEQASGGEVDSRSDLYALGCVLYEMLAGLPPLTGPTPQATAAMRLTETATPLPVIRETVPGGLAQVVSRALAKSPVDRYGTAEKLVEALGHTDRRADLRPKPRLRKRVLSVVVAVVFLALGMSVTKWFVGRSRGSESLQGGAALDVVPQRIAVLPFENATGDSALEYLGQLVAERLTSRLQQEDVGEVVPGRSVMAGIEGADSRDPVDAVAAATGASLLVDGVMTRVADSLWFGLRLTDPVTGTLQGAFDHVSPSDNVPDPALQEIGSRLAGGLLLAFWGEEPDEAMKVYPKVEAYRALREGVEYRYAGKLQQALDRFYESRALDTTFVVPVAWAWGAAISMGQQQEADSLQALLDSLKSGEPGGDVHRFIFEALRSEKEGNWEDACGFGRTAAAASEDVTVELTMATSCLAANRPSEALETLLGIQGPSLDEPMFQGMYLVRLAHAYHMLGDYVAELEAARAHDRLGLGGLQPLFSMYLIARAAAALGHTDEVHAVQDRLESWLEPNAILGWLIVVPALELRHRGFHEDARTLFARTTRWFEEHQEWLSENATHRLDYGQALYYSEHWEEAYAVLRPLEELSPDSFRLQELLPAYLGLLAARRGDVESAAAYSAQLDRIEIDDPDMQAGLTAYRGRIAAVLGQEQEATVYLKQAFDEGLRYTPRAYPHSRYSFDFESLADYAPYRELLRPKG